jgi:hypothetical protein
MSCIKQSYSNYKEAEKHLDGLRKSNAGKHKIFKTYKCPECGMLHITTVHKHKLMRPKKDDKYPLLMEKLPAPIPVKVKKNKPRSSSAPTAIAPATSRLLTNEQANALRMIINRNK